MVRRNQGSITGNGPEENVVVSAFVLMDACNSN